MGQLNGDSSPDFEVEGWGFKVRLDGCGCCLLGIALVIVAFAAEAIILAI